MGVRIHSVPTYQVKYGNTISSQLSDDVIRVFRDSETGWVSDTEENGEISREELLGIIGDMPDGELKSALELLERESDKHNDFVRWALY